jgi:hypothetical protein
MRGRNASNSSSVFAESSERITMTANVGFFVICRKFRQDSEISEYTGKTGKTPTFPVVTKSLR